MEFWDFHTHNPKRKHAIFNQMGLNSFFASRPCSLGIHPWNLDVHWEEKLIQIQEVSKFSPQVLAIGETGFDRIKGPKISLQKEAFYAHARWARSLDIPLILHCVKSHDLLLEFLKNEKNPPAIIWHGWNQKPELARPLLSYPVFFSFGKHIGQETGNAAKWLAECPLERVFFESDDSNLEIETIYQAASLILQLPVERLTDQVVSNWNSISQRKIS
jgi:TatD DNase family protein